jgi:hypothetical protein
MTELDLLDAIGSIDKKYVEDANDEKDADVLLEKVHKNNSKKVRGKVFEFRKWMPIAVCIALLITVGIITAFILKNGKSANSNVDNDLIIDAVSQKAGDDGRIQSDRTGSIDSGKIYLEKINNGSEQGIVDIEPLAISEGRKLAEKIQNQLPEDVWGGYYSVSNWIYYNPEELNNFTVYIRIVKDYDNLPVYDNVVYERVRYSWDELNSYRKKLNEHKEEFGITSAVVVKDDKIEVTVTELTALNEEKLYDLAPKEMLTVRTQGSGLKIHENEMVEKTTDINQLISREDFKQMAEEELSGLNAELSEFTINEAEIDIKLNFWKEVYGEYYEDGKRYVSYRREEETDYAEAEKYIERLSDRLRQKGVVCLLKLSVFNQLEDLVYYIAYDYEKNTEDSWVMPELELWKEMLKEGNGEFQIPGGHSEVSKFIDNIPIILEIGDVTSTGLSMTLRQDGERENHYYQYGDSFFLEKMEDKEWLPVTKAYGETNAINIVYPIYGDTELMIDWKEMYGSLEPGIYRLNKEFYDRDIYGAAFKHILSVQFSISGD